MVIQSFFATSVMTCFTSSVFTAASSTGRALMAGFSGVLTVCADTVGATFSAACDQADAMPVGVPGIGGGSILSLSSGAVVVIGVATGCSIGAVFCIPTG